MAPFTICPMPHPGHQMWGSRSTLRYLAASALAMLHHPLDPAEHLAGRDQHPIVPVHLSHGHVVAGNPPDLGGNLTQAVSYTHLRAHETRHDLVCRLLLEKKKK